MTRRLSNSTPPQETINGGIARFDSGWRKKEIFKYFTRIRIILRRALKMKISFKEFCGLSKEEQKHLGSTLNEELSANLKKKKMRELERILKKMDFFYQYIDGD